jgi:hypothetical protein
MAGADPLRIRGRGNTSARSSGFVVAIVEHMHLLQGRYNDLSSRSQKVNDILQELFQVTLRANIRIREHRIPTMVIVDADMQSRTAGAGPFESKNNAAISTSASVGLSRAYFCIVQAFGMEQAGCDFTVDICADKVNHSFRVTTRFTRQQLPWA